MEISHVEVSSVLPIVSPFLVFRVRNMLNKRHQCSFSLLADALSLTFTSFSNDFFLCVSSPLHPYVAVVTLFFSHSIRIPSTDHRQFCPSWQQGHAVSLLRERLADVSLAVLHGSSSPTSRCSSRLSSGRAGLFYCDSAPWLRAGGPRAAHRRGTCSSCVGTGLRCSSSQLFRIGSFSISVNFRLLAGCEVLFTFFGLDNWATKSKTWSLGLIWPRSRNFAELLKLCFSCWLRASIAEQREHCVASSHSRTREHFLNLSVIADG